MTVDCCPGARSAPSDPFAKPAAIAVVAGGCSAFPHVAIAGALGALALAADDDMNGLAWTWMDGRIPCRLRKNWSESSDVVPGTFSAGHKPAYEHDSVALVADAEDSCTAAAVVAA